MKSISKRMHISAVALCAAVAAGFAAPAAQAGEFCSTNMSGMRGCGFSTLEQCLASMSGQAGTCARDPFYKDPREALAYHPKHGRGAAKQTVEQ